MWEPWLPSREQYPHRIWNRSKPRWSCPTPTTCTYAPATKSSNSWEASINSCPGTNPYSPIPAASRYFPWQPCGKSRKKESTSTPTSMEEKYSWARRKACRSSPTWPPPLPWPLTNAPLPRRNGPMWKIPWPAPPAGWNAAKPKWPDSIPRKTPSTKTSSFSASTRERFTRISESNTPKGFLN